MTTATVRPIRRPSLDHRTAMRLARTEYERFTETLAALDDADWSRPTDCPGWDVRAMASHVLGMVDMSASMRDGIRQFRSALRADGPFLDELTGLQVRERTGLDGGEITARLRRNTGKAARSRRLTPVILRSRTLPVLQDVGGVAEPWSIGYLADIILTRDPWMHRADIARATGRAMRLTPDHDGVLVDDVVREWADRHGAPYELSLTGVAGGSWHLGAGGEQITMDAIEFCRALSGRAPQPGLLRFSVPF